ncbi:MAG: GNAT family N-acetyltransferase [Ferruginibacter sp.]
MVGFALYYIRYSTWKGQRLYLEDILVTDRMRGKGIGKAAYLIAYWRFARKKITAEWCGRCSIGTSRPSISIKNTRM